MPIPPPPHSPEGYDMLHPVSPPAEEPAVTEAPTQDIETGVAAAPMPRWKSVIKKTGWGLLGLVLLVFFTLIKLPQEQIKSYVQTTLSSVLADQGMTLSTGQTSLSYLFGISYTMKDVTITSATGIPIKLEEVGISPSILPLIFGKQGASFWVRTHGGGKLNGSGSVSGNNFSFSFKASDLDLKKSGIIEALAHVSAAGMLNGSGSVSGNLINPMQTNGSFRIDLAKVGMDAQSIFGFSVPKINISEGKADFDINKGRVQIKSLNLGKRGNPSDDIQATVTGDMNLARQFEASSLNLKAKFSLSETILKSFVLLDTLLNSGKQPDGSYAFQITGTVGVPNSEPLKP